MVSYKFGGETPEQTVSNRDISFSYPSDFGLAVKPEQIPVKSYIPPCDENFDYCLYYLGTKYEGTNFESAGLRIKQRTDLAKENCDFGQKIGDAALGHYATGNLYRIFINDSCYEFETRLGLTQFANYATGTIEEFTQNDQTEMEAKLQRLLEEIAAGRKKLIFPKI
jgi:hypothetical protein